VSKWWGRLQGAALGPGSGFETPDILVHGCTDTLSIIPVVRSALDVVYDLYEAIPQIQQYVHHMVTKTAGSIAFLLTYLRSSDPKTAIAASVFLESILKKMNMGSDKDKKGVDSDNLKEIYLTTIKELHTYCSMYSSSKQIIDLSSTSLKMNTRGKKSRKSKDEEVI
jgi:hypothetical protein